MAQANIVVEFWRRLRGSVHPDDQKIISSSLVDVFDVQYPPPAFVGDILNAQIFVLMANGGKSDPVRLAKEFEGTDSEANYLFRLHNPGPAEERYTSPYYQRGILWEKLRSGQVCVINAVAYRSKNVNSDVRHIAELLPSVSVHREWLTKYAIPAARSKRIAIISKRPALWNFPRKQFQNSGVFDDPEGTRYVSKESWRNAMRWLSS